VRPHATTIIAVLREDGVAMAGDGQVTFGEVVMKHGARKIRTLQDGTILAGFAGAVADALTLIEKFEAQLKAWDGNMRRAAVELAKEWRTDRYLRRLEAQLLIAEVGSLLLISGDGDVIEPDDGIAAIGSGAPYATAAARALSQHTELGAKDVAMAAMEIAADLCIYTNDHFNLEWIAADGSESSEATDLEGEAELERGTKGGESACPDRRRTGYACIQRANCTEAGEPDTGEDGGRARQVHRRAS
jgi:ATP-dependent HslUV protease subunit HslV